jgi:hypothetical protein
MDLLNPIPTTLAAVRAALASPTVVPLVVRRVVPYARYAMPDEDDQLFGVHAARVLVISSTPLNSSDIDRIDEIMCGFGLVFRVWHTGHGKHFGSYTYTTPGLADLIHREAKASKDAARAAYQASGELVSLANNTLHHIVRNADIAEHAGLISTLKEESRADGGNADFPETYTRNYEQEVAQRIHKNDPMGGSWITRSVARQAAGAVLDLVTSDQEWMRSVWRK